MCIYPSALNASVAISLIPSGKCGRLSSNLNHRAVGGEGGAERLGLERLCTCVRLAFVSYSSYGPFRCFSAKGFGRNARIIRAAAGFVSSLDLSYR